MSSRAKNFFVEPVSIASQIVSYIPLMKLTLFSQNQTRAFSLYIILILVSPPQIELTFKSDFSLFYNKS